MDRQDMEQYFEGLEVEFNAQRASTLGRFGKRLEEESIRCANQLNNLGLLEHHRVDEIFPTPPRR